MFDKIDCSFCWSNIIMIESSIIEWGVLELVDICCCIWVIVGVFLGNLVEWFDFYVYLFCLFYFVYIFFLFGNIII